MYGHQLLYRRIIWLNRVRLPNLLLVSSTGKLSVHADASVLNTSICTGTVLLFVFVYIPGIFLIWGHTYTFMHGSLLYMIVYMCNYSGMYVELCLYVRPSQPGKVANPARGQLAEQRK